MKQLISLIYITFILAHYSVVYGQESAFNLKEGNGTLQTARGFADNEGFKIILFEFIPLSRAMIFLDPENREVSRLTADVSDFDFHGFSSKNGEVVLYFSGVINRKKSDYLVAFFKDAARRPLLTEWLDKPKNGSDVAAYSYNDQMILIQTSKKRDNFFISKVTSPNMVETLLPFSSNEKIDEILADDLLVVNPTGFAGSQEPSTLIYPSETGFHFFNVETKQERAVLLKYKFNFLNSTIEKSEHQTRYNKKITVAQMDSLLFVYHLASTRNENLFDLEIRKLPTMATIATYSALGDQVEYDYHSGVLTNFSGEKFEHKTTNIHQKMRVGAPWLSINPIEGCYALRLGSHVITQASMTPIGGHSYMMPGDNELNFFNIVVTPLLKPCNGKSEKEPYYIALMSFQSRWEGKRKAGKLYFIDEEKEITSFNYDDHANAFFIRSVARDKN